MKTVDFYMGFHVGTYTNPMGSHGICFSSRSKVACAEAAELLEGARRRMAGIGGLWPPWLAGKGMAVFLGCAKGSQVPLEQRAHQ